MAFSFLRFASPRPIEAFASRPLESRVRYSTCRPDNLLIDGSIAPEAAVFCHFALCDVESDRDQVMAELTREARDTDGVVESIQLALRPYKHRGTLNWLDPKRPGPIFEPYGGAPTAGPIVSMTSGGYTEPLETQPERVSRFIVNTVSVGEDIRSAQGLKFRRLFSPSASADDPITISVWDSERAMSDYAYRPGAHDDRARRQNESSFYFDRNSFTRFTIDRATGRWEGVEL